MNKKSSFIIPGGLFIGLGIGMALDNPGVGIFIGLGAGFILTFIYSLMEDRKKQEL
ncbi:hypothetical protein [Sediminibacillus massiliensis]|uniref:hypothetical protein n=1 Tax=Sediminibacillus massiliensis TaxID=1926277 RepID=UPI0015C3B98F|nr:hypothetical protein [Sediminibacillus massiliensis]